jgi:hypothetical protein
VPCSCGARYLHGLDRNRYPIEAGCNQVGDSEPGEHAAGREATDHDRPDGERQEGAEIAAGAGEFAHGMNALGGSVH